MFRKVVEKRQRVGFAATKLRRKIEYGGSLRGHSVEASHYLRGEFQHVLRQKCPGEELLWLGVHVWRRTVAHTLYRLGSDWSKMSFWLAAHDLIAKYVRPNVASQWRAESRAVTDEADLKRWLDLVHPDEFPLGTFHLNLQKQIGKMPGYARDRALVA